MSDKHPQRNSVTASGQLRISRQLGENFFIATRKSKLLGIYTNQQSYGWPVMDKSVYRQNSQIKAGHTACTKTDQSQGQTFSKNNRSVHKYGQGDIARKTSTQKCLSFVRTKSVVGECVRIRHSNHEGFGMVASRGEQLEWSSNHEEDHRLIGHLRRIPLGMVSCNEWSGGSRLLESPYVACSFQLSGVNVYPVGIKIISHRASRQARASQDLSDLAQTLWTEAYESNITLTCKHFPGVLNCHADSLSRLPVSPYNWNSIQDCLHT